MDVKLQQILAKVQTVPGTFESLAAADGKTALIVGVTPEYKPQKTKLDIARATSAKRGSVTGMKPMSIPVQCYAGLPDAPGTDTLPYDAFLRSSGLLPTQVWRIPIGAITSGPVPRGATVTGGAGTGRVVIEAVTGDSHIYYVPISGTVATGALTFTGGATATASGATAAWGWSGLLTTPGARQVISSRLEEDGMQYSIRDAVSNMTLSVEDGKPGIFAFPLSGVRHSTGAAALTSSVTYHAKKEPVLLNAKAKIGSFSVPMFSATLDLQNVIAQRKNASQADDTGIAGYRITDVDPMLSIVMEMPVASAYDVLASMEADATVAIGFRIGTAAGNTIWVFADEAQPMEPSFSEDEGIRRVQANYACTAASSGRPLELVFI